MWALTSVRSGLSFTHAALLLLLPVLLPLCGGPMGASWTRWVGGGGLSVNWGWGLDSIGAAMSSLVGVVAFVVVVFSRGYLQEDPHLGPFLGLLVLFSLAMVGLVSGPTLLQAFIGWEGVGLLSYLLINFWSGRGWAGRAATKAMVINKVGDVAYLVGLAGTLYFFGSLSLIGTASALSFPITWLACFFFVASSSKSAQFLLHLWLPDAMEGPTPVSALIHAATMVTAGVFLVVRLGHLMESLAVAVAWVGGTTALFSAAVGASQWDTKKVIAYSTCSQLGYLFLSVGYGGLEFGMYHLLTHGFFKALLFLSAGFVIFLSTDEQDLRHGGGMSTPLPYALLLPASLALVGFPFFAGFFSKDALLELALSSSAWSCAGWFAVFAAALTSYYSFRLLGAVGFTPPRGRPTSPSPCAGLWLALLVLVLFSAWGGLFISLSLVGGAPPPLGFALHYVPLVCLAIGLSAAALALAPAFSARLSARPLVQWGGSLGLIDSLGGGLGHASGAWGGATGYRILDRSLLPGLFVSGTISASLAIVYVPALVLTSRSSFVLGLFFSALLGGAVHLG